MEWPTAEEVERFCAECEAFYARVKLVPIPKELKRQELLKLGFAVQQYRLNQEYPSRQLDSEAYGMYASLWALAGCAAEVCERVYDAVPTEEQWRQVKAGGFSKLRDMADKLQAAAFPLRRYVPDAE